MNIAFGWPDYNPLLFKHLPATGPVVDLPWPAVLLMCAPVIFVFGMIGWVMLRNFGMSGGGVKMLSIAAETWALATMIVVGLLAVYIVFGGKK